MVENIVGKRFTRLVVIEEAERPDRISTMSGKFFRCRCDCGNIVVKWRCVLVTERAKSCGCLRRELGRATVHRAQKAWENLENRKRTYYIPSKKKIPELTE